MRLWAARARTRANRIFVAWKCVLHASICVSSVLTLWCVKCCCCWIPVRLFVISLLQRFQLNECNVCVLYSSQVQSHFLIRFLFSSHTLINRCWLSSFTCFAAHLPIVVLNLFLFPFRHNTTSIHHRFIRFERHTQTHTAECSGMVKQETTKMTKTKRERQRTSKFENNKRFYFSPFEM